MQVENRLAEDPGGRGRFFAPAKLKIVHVTASLSPSTGGPATVVSHLAAAQRSLGHDVSIISCLSPRHAAAFHDASVNIPDFSRVQTHLRPWTSEWSRLFGTRMLPLYNQVIPSADIVHIHGVWEPMLLAAAQVARNHGVPYAVRPCGMLDPWALAQRGFKKRLAMKFMHRHMLDHAAFIHALTPQESLLMKPLGIDATQVVIPNGVCLHEIDQAPDEAFFSRVPALRRKRYLLFLGRIHHKKGLDILAEAFAQIAQLFPEIHLLVVGPDGGAQASFQDLIGRYQLTHRVHLPGPLVGAAKFAAYRNAEAFCLPSRQEGFSNAVIEALAASVPVAISSECHLPEVEHIHAGRVFPLGVQAAVGALHDLLSVTREQRRHMGMAARQFIEQNLTWTQIARQTLDTYDALLLTRAAARMA